MRVALVSKALVVGEYQRKLEALAQEPDLDLTCIVPPCWQEPGGRRIELERAHLRGYRLVVEPIRFNGSFHLFYFPSLAARLRALAPDLVHVDEEPYNLATFLATRQALAVGARPLFFTWQNLARRYPPPWRWTERYVLQHSAFALAGNAEAEQVLRAKGYRGPSACVPQFGVDERHFQPAPCEPEGPFTLGFVGRLVEEKGILVLLEALAGLAGPWRALLIGSGPLRELALQRIASLGLGERVRLETSVPSTQMADRLRGLHALALPSLTRPHWKEQFGRALVEAMACGLPVVGSQCGEIPNVVGEAGLLVPEGDVPALREALDRLRRDPALRQELGRRGRERVLQRYTHTRIAAETARVYRQVCRLEVEAG
ncbi:MAG: glycosyltransferase family 4 protein [Chloroflexi bacterium]|nr:glycosyltransferase family 4 protein [Chloroflexota bacterium]